VSRRKRREEARPIRIAPPPADPTEALKRRFAANLVALRGAVDLSQEATAERAGLHRSEVHLLERGLRVPQLETIVRLGGAVEAEPAKFLVHMRWSSAASDSPRGGGAFSVDVEAG